MYVGLLKEFMEFLETNNIQYEFYGNIIDREKISDEILKNFITRLKLCFDVYDHQYSAIKTVIENKRHTILSPTSSGKSLIIAVLMAFFLAMKKDKEKKLLLIVPNKFLVNQMYSDMCLYFSKSGLDLRNYIQPIHSEIKKRDLTKPIIITTWQSQKGTDFKFLETFNENFMNNVDFLIYDEVHYSTAVESKAVIESAINARYKVGLTGTLFDNNDYKNTVIKGLFGDIVSFITTREMIDLGIASELDIYQIRLKFSDILQSGSGYQDELDFIRKNDAYLKYVVSFVAKNCRDGNTIILHRSILFGKRAKEMMNKLFPKIKTYVINGGIPASEREKIRHKLADENGVVIFATYDTTSMGVSINNLHYGCFLEGMKSNIRVIQSIGRLLRKNYNKERAVLYDFVPVLNIKTERGYRIGTLSDHGNDRIRHYKSEEHKLKVLEYDF